MRSRPQVSPAAPLLARRSSSRSLPRSRLAVRWSLGTCCGSVRSPLPEWLGLLITGLNLLPIGQLDGRHAARAMFGSRRGEAISSVAMWSLLLLALFVWPGLMMWALFIFFVAGRGTPPLDDLTPVTPGRRWLGYATFLLLAVILLPLPQTFWPAGGAP